MLVSKQIPEKSYQYQIDVEISRIISCLGFSIIIPSRILFETRSVPSDHVRSKVTVIIQNIDIKVPYGEISIISEYEK